MGELLANRFEVLSELGRGGMGIVYRVADTHHEGRELALKTFNGQGAISEDSRLRFKEEFLAMVRLRHPNTIEVFDYGQLDDLTQFLTMEIVRGAELRELIDAGPLPLEQVYALLVQLLQGLGFIHARNYVHRDIKAENIRVREDGVLKLMDFGLMDQMGQLSSGKITGTPGYLPPEVAKGGIIDATSDLYSVGCLAYELVTGNRPFTGGVVEVIRAHIDRKPPLLRQVRPDVPARLEAIVSRLLEKDSRLRYQDAAEVIADLSELSGFSGSRQNLEQKKSYLVSSTLVGRDREVSELGKAMEEVVQGRGRSVFVGAPAGVGKTRLVTEHLLKAKLEGFVILRGQCLEAGMAGYDCLGQVLRNLVGLLTPEEIATHGPALARLLPELAEQGIVALPPLIPSSEKIRISETVAALLRELSARTPVIVFMDDLHWIDPQSLDVFNQCIRWLGDSKVLCLATFRNDEISQNSPAWYTVSEGLTLYLKLDAFNQAQMMLLLHAMLKNMRINREFSDFLFRSTAGNAFFLTEVLRFMLEDGTLALRDGIWWFPAETETLELPMSVEATVIRRLAQLSDDARALARIASIIGRFQDRAMLLEISGLNEEAFFAGLDELLDRQFILKDELRYTFPHDRVREALYEDAPEVERRRLHQRCGEYLEARHAGSEALIINELAHHFGRGQDSRKALEYLRQAAKAAVAADSVPLAIRYWKQAQVALATVEMPPSDKEVVLVDLLWNIGYYGYIIWPGVAIESLGSLIPLLRGKFDVARATRALGHVAQTIRRKRPDLMLRAMKGLLSGQRYDHRMWNDRRRFSIQRLSSWLTFLSEVEGRYAIAYGLSGQAGKGMEQLNRTIPMMPYKGSPMEGLLLYCQVSCLTPAGHFDACLAVMDRCKQLVTEKLAFSIPGFFVVWLGICGTSSVVAFQGLRPPQEDLDYVLKLCDSQKLFALKNFYLCRTMLWHAWAGRYQEAQEVIEEMNQNSRRGSAPIQRWVYYMRPYLLWQRGEQEEALSAVQHALQIPDVGSDTFVEELARILRGHIYLSDGDLAKAKQDFLDATDRARDNKMLLVLIKGLMGLGEHAIATQDWLQAADYLEEARSLSSSGPARNPLHQAISERLLGVVAAAQGRLEDATEHFEAARAILADPAVANTIEQGHLYRAMGEAHLAHGNKDAARAALSQAGQCYAEIKNRFLLAPVARLLEELSTPASVATEVHEQSRVVARASASTQHEALRDLLTQTLSLSTDDEIYQSVLETCIHTLNADEGAFLLLEPVPRVIAHRPRAGSTAELRLNGAFLEQVRRTGEGMVGIDVPEDMVFGTGSNLDVEIPSVMVAPARVQQTGAVFYLVKWNLLEPFGPDTLAELSAFCTAFSDSLGARLTLAP